MPKRLTEHPFEKRSGNIPVGNAVPKIKADNFITLDPSVGGDAPKDVIRMYIYDGIARKDSKRTWPTYIAKIGHKWYPNESVTEQLITEIGMATGIKMAHSILVNIESTIRFCSKHFHTKQQALTHGAEILSRYVEESNEEWIDDLEERKEIRAFINVEDVIGAIRKVFDRDSEGLVYDFVHMLLFDCFIGNNDRHYYNWGVITHPLGKHRPYFAPVYDSARALWWNSPDNFIVSLHKDRTRRKVRIESYVRKSVPKTSIPGNETCNHFELINYLRKAGYIEKSHREFLKEENLQNICELVDEKFSKLMVLERREIIKDTLSLRYLEMKKILC